MIRAAEDNGRILMTAQVLRFYSTYIPLAARVKTGELGTVRSAIFRRRCSAPAWGKWLADPSQSGGGVFDLLIHDVDQCIDLFGIPEAVSATGFVNLPAGIDIINAELHYPNVNSVLVTGGWHHPAAYPFSMEYTIVCDGGTIDYSSASRPTPTLYDAGGNANELPVPQQDGYEAEIAYFVECCVAARKPERCPPEESSAAVKLTRLMVDARESKGEKVACKI
jgi:predicted dehydrogenase